jgi:iron complex outermembrane recepter protein
VPNAARSIFTHSLLALFAAIGVATAQQPAPTPQTAVPADRDANGNAIVVEAPKPEDPMRDVTEIDRVTVTGTNISESPPFVPESIFNREAVERAGSRSLGDFFQSMPANSGPTFTENQSDSLSPGAAAVALRGLGPDATLVLVNGRRVAPYPFAQAGITAFVDLNSLPLAAIQQIDILRDGASAIYGTDAIAGVVNVRFLRSYDGALVSFGYGNTTDSDVSEYRAAFISGYTNEQRGIELVAVGDFFDRAALFQTDRYYSASNDQRRLGGTSFLSSVANPGTVFEPVTGNPLRVPAAIASIARPSLRSCRRRNATASICAAARASRRQ